MVKFADFDIFRATAVIMVPVNRASNRGTARHTVQVDGRDVVFDPTLTQQRAQGPQVFTVGLLLGYDTTWGRSIPAYHAASWEDAHRVAAVAAETLQCEAIVVDQYDNKDGFAWCAYQWYGETRCALGCCYSTYAPNWYAPAHTREDTKGLTLVPDEQARWKHGVWKLAKAEADKLRAQIAGLSVDLAAYEALMQENG